MPKTHQHKSGQAIIFLMVVMVIGILAVVWSYDLHRVVNAKLRMRNAGDAAALAAARWQGHTLNMIGDLNLIQAALIAADATGGGADPVLSELKARLDYVGPLAAFAVAQQAAFNNGALPDPELSANLLEMAETFREDLIWNPYPDAAEEYADLLENIAVRGAAVSSYGLRIPRHPLVQEQFYGAIAQAMASWWCPMHSYRYQLENYEDFESWPKLDTEFEYRRIFDLQLDEFSTGNDAVPSSAISFSTPSELRQELGPYLQELDFALNNNVGPQSFFGDDTAVWHVYNNSWTKQWPRPAYYDDDTSERGGRFPISDSVKVEYNYLGAVAGIAMAADVHRGILSSSGNEEIGLEYKAKAKVFGFLDVPDSTLPAGGSLVPPHYFGFVLPCFQDVRLVHSDIGEKQINGVFYKHITKHLEPYLERGPSACDPECPYCRLLVSWESLDRQEGLEWLDRAYSDDHDNPCRPEINSDNLHWDSAGGGATGGS